MIEQNFQQFSWDSNLTGFPPSTPYTLLPMHQSHTHTDNLDCVDSLFRNVIEFHHFQRKMTMCRVFHFLASHYLYNPINYHFYPPSLQFGHFCLFVLPRHTKHIFISSLHLIFPLLECFPLRDTSLIPLLHQKLCSNVISSERTSPTTLSKQNPLILVYLKHSIT